MATQKPVTDLVREFADGSIAVPEIQRNVVWKPDQVKKLIGSIFSQFPCGSLIFWQARENDKGLVRSWIRPERLEQLHGKLPNYFLLEGQQRLTALARAIRKIQVQYLQVPIREIIPELDREPAEHMHTHAPPDGVVFDIITEIGWEGGDCPESLEQALLVSPAEGPAEVKNFDRDQQPGVAHPASFESPSSRPHSSAVRQRSGDRSSIRSASLAA